MEFCQASESEAVQVTLLYTGCKIAELYKRPGHIVRAIRKEPVYKAYTCVVVEVKSI